MCIIGKDKIIGLIIILVGFLIAITYTLGSVIDFWLQSSWAGSFFNTDGFIIPGLPDIFDWRFFIVFPLWIFIIVVSVISIWIGYSMLTTPAPIPLEELEEELDIQKKS